MNFRSSLYLPKGSENLQQTTWFEAHEWGDDYVIAKLTGVPEEQRPKWYLPFSRAAREVDRPKTLPPSAIVVATAADAQDALEKLIALEVGLQSTHRIMELGDYCRPKVRHYVDLIDGRHLPVIPLPPVIVDTAEKFTKDLMGRFVLGEISQYMMEGARSQMVLYRKLPRAEPQQP